MSKKLDFSVEAPPGDGRPEAERRAPEATPPKPPAPEAALAPGERALSHSEHMELILAGKAGPAVARGERRAGWPEHLRDNPAPPPFDPSLPPGTRELTFAEVCALQDAQRAERAALRAERCAARGRPAPEARAFA